MDLNSGSLSLAGRVGTSAFRMLHPVIKSPLAVWLATIWIVVMPPLNLRSANPMKDGTFSEYALSKSLTDDEKYTIELLIDRVRSSFDATYWDNWTKRNDAREKPDYQPHFSETDVRMAATELSKLTWVSLQRIRSAERPVRDLNAFRFFPSITGLVLTQNEVEDLSPLRHCKNLHKLYLSRNRVKDLSPLTECVNIEYLELRGNPLLDLTTLESLPNLKTLEIDSDQLTQFRKLSLLPTLQKLDHGSASGNFVGFPKMPKLRSLWGGRVESLSGLEQFPSLENLINLSGGFDSLEPLRDLRKLTHINIGRCSVGNLKPIGGLLALRDLWIDTDVSELDMTPLEALPALHELTIRCDDVEPAALPAMRRELSSWDVEFYSAKPRHTPSLEIEVVDQKTFDHYDTHESYGVGDMDTNELLLNSELEWLDGKLAEVFAVDFKKDEDYAIPFQWGGARSRTVVLLSEEAIEAFPRLALGIQNVLSHARNDWIIYFQSDAVSDEEEFIVWVYPEKILVTPEYAKTVHRLVVPK